MYALSGFVTGGSIFGMAMASVLSINYESSCPREEEHGGQDYFYCGFKELVASIEAVYMPKVTQN